MVYSQSLRTQTMLVIFLPLFIFWLDNELFDPSKVGASRCNMNDDVTTYPMMTSLCVIDFIMLGLV